MSPITELTGYLAKFSARCRAARWFPALAHVSAVADIAQDVEATRAHAEALAHKAEVHDAEAEAVLDEALLDGLDAADIPRVRKAIAALRRSREADQQLGQLLRA
jgi:hypothetical protein